MGLNLTGLQRDWDEQGYLLVRGLLPPERVRRLRDTCMDVWNQWVARDPQTGLPGDPDGRAMRHPNHPDYFRKDRSGLIDLMELAADPNAILPVVRISTEVDPMFRTLTIWRNPVSKSEDGNWHRDSQFMTQTDEEEKPLIFAKNRGMQLQIALVPSEDSEYVPRAHLRWDTPEEYRIRKAENPADRRSNAMPGAVRVSLQPGDAVAFNSGGLHRGRYHADKPRCTLMLTYTSVDTPIHDKFIMQPWFGEPGYLDGLSPRACRFYQKFIDTFPAGLAGAAGGGCGQLIPQ